MKYIFIFVFIFMIGCNNINHKNINTSKESNNSLQNNKTIKQHNITKIIVDKLIFLKNKNDIKYSFKENKILVFLNDNKFSKTQIEELKKLNKKYYIIKNDDLKEYFKITTFPTIIITKDNNHTKKYEGFMPYEILKYEIKETK